MKILTKESALKCLTNYMVEKIGSSDKTVITDKKPDWYQVKLLILQVPVVEAVWILRESYINGETFTMNGIKIRLEKVKIPGSREASPSKPHEDSSSNEQVSKDNKVVSLFDRKKG